MRTVGVVSVGRSDYSIYRPILQLIKADPELELILYVAGAHWSKVHGETYKEIVRDGFDAIVKIETKTQGDQAKHIVHTIAETATCFADLFATKKPDVLLVLGDRYEMFAAAVAAVPFNIPIAHIHGGELTEGAFDDCFRHSLTKISHLHFVATEQYKQRVIQMGEEPWRVTVSGAPALDNLSKLDCVPVDQLWQRLQFNFSSAPILCTFHPVTREIDKLEYQVQQLLLALEKISQPVIFTAPNGDTHFNLIRSMISKYISQHSDSMLADNLGSELYFSVLKAARVMLGNSSSGIIEAASFELPVVNIGTRQQGRTRAANVLDVDYECDQIVAAVNRASSQEFRTRLKGLVNPYYKADAAQSIVNGVKALEVSERILIKKFYDIETSKTKAE